MGHQEIERKFLVCGEFKHLAVDKARITQGYLAHSEGRSARVRSWNDKGFLTIKGPTDESGVSRFEWEKEISFEDSQVLLDLVRPSVIEKTRYLIPAGDGVHTWEVDEFYGDNEGLVVAEIELGSPDEAFEKPAWVGEEVSADKRYRNSYLLKLPYKFW